MNTNDFSEAKSDRKVFKPKKERTYKEMRSEMCEELYKYTLELRDSNFYNQYPKLAQFKKNLFPALDNLIKQCDIIRDDKLRMSKLKIIYVWFSAKRDSYNNLANINKLTLKQEYQRIEEPVESRHKPYEAGNVNDKVDNNFRSETKEAEPAKIRIKEYLPKSLLPPINKQEEPRKKVFLNQNIETAAKSQFTSPSPTNSISQTTRYTTNYDSSVFKNIKLNARSSVAKSFDKIKPKILTEPDPKWVNEKNKEVAEKRSMSEVNKYIEEWAITRSKLHEEVERKTDIKFFLKNYPMSEVIDEEKGTIDTNNKSISNDKNDQVIEIGKQEKISIQKLKNVVNNKVKKSKLIIKKIKIQSKSNNFSPDKKDKIYKENLDNFDKIPTDVNADMTANNKLLQTRQLYCDSVNTAEVSNPKNGYLLHFNPLSIFDNGSPLKTEKTYDKAKRSISLDLKECNPEKHNMYSQRKTLAYFNISEVNRLKDDLARESINIPMKTLKKAFVSPETVVYPKYYLPSSGFGFLSNPFAEGKRKIT